VQGWISHRETALDATTFTLDDCPPDADCDGSRLCEIALQGFGADAAGVLEAFPWDAQYYGWAEDGFVRLFATTACCRGPGCFCGPYTALYARVGDPDAPAPDMLERGQEDLPFSRGESTCAERDCGEAPFRVAVELRPSQTSVAVVPAPIELAVGETADLGDTSLRAHLVSAAVDPCINLPARAGYVVWNTRGARGMDDGVDDRDRNDAPTRGH
jgi:hypothetical protein